MPNNGKTYKLNEIADILNSKRIPLNSRQRNDRKGIFPYYGASGVVDFIDDFIFDGEHVLISEDGENLRSRNTPIAFKAKGKFWVNNHAHIVKGKEEFLNNWIVYHFSNLDLNPYISGAVQPKLNKEALLSIPIKIPQFDEAKQIVTILSAIDDKIENNLAINKTLEEMAMALYKHWFVDFGPFQDGEFVESELGRIPKGWEVKTIYDVCDVVYGAAFKSKLFNENKEGFPLIRIRDLKTLKPQYYTLENHPKKTIIETGEIQIIPDQTIFTTMEQCNQYAEEAKAIQQQKAVTGESDPHRAIHKCVQWGTDA